MTEQEQDRKINVLIADDDPDTIVLLRRTIKKALVGNQVELSVVTNGREAEDLIAQDDQQFDLVILDQNMGTPTGREVIRHQLDRLQKALVILFTDDEGVLRKIGESPLPHEQAENFKALRKDPRLVVPAILNWLSMLPA